jgi:hypothetical protein
LPSLLEPLPPFDYPTESIEEAAQQLLDHSAQLKFLTKRVGQIAERQDASHRNSLRLETAINRIADGQTVCNGLMDLFNRRLKKLMQAQNVDDVEDADIVEGKLL